MIKNNVLMLLTIVFSMIFTSCMKVTVEGDGAKTPDSKFGKETIYGTFYGFNWNDRYRKVRKAENGLGLFRVEYTTNAAYTTLSIVSLGLCVPVDIDYWVESPSEIRRLEKVNK
ncbi:MAG: hypothetical protein GY730_02920 [bacterium]|nr:hypothetical protein [bacterium]MCP4108398.1 hypothetical protein [Desulfobacteraceae bacterium]